jgi:hypothetical protein
MQVYIPTIHVYTRAGAVQQLSVLSVGRSTPACAVFENSFWIAGGAETGVSPMDIVESFDLR